MCFQADNQWIRVDEKDESDTHEQPVNTPNKKVSRKGEKIAPVIQGRGPIKVIMLRGIRVIARNAKDGLYYPGMF